MATMTIDIPDGMTAQVIVGSTEGLVRREPLQITDQRVSAEEPERQHRRRPVLIATVGLAILAAGFTIGTHTRTSHWAAQAETASVAMASPPAPAPAPSMPDPPPATVAFPTQAPSAPPGPVGPPSAVGDASAQPAPSGQMPVDLAAVLKAPPQVTPPPGQPANSPPVQPDGSTPPAANPFGLGG
jgi:hypothetical protein